MEEELRLTQLGRRVDIPASPDEAVLETMANPHPGEAYLVRFTSPEFTALCPITGQPDFARFVVDYVPAAAPRSLRIGGYWYPHGGIQSTSSTGPAIRRPACGCPTKACGPIAGGTEPRP